MNVLRTVAFFSCLILVSCQTALLQRINTRCSINDVECQRELFQTIMSEISENGIPDPPEGEPFPPVDPFYIENLSIPVLGLLNFNLVQGTVTGVKDCDVQRFQTSLEERSNEVDITCNILINGKYNVNGVSDVLQQIFGGGSTVNGEGNIEIKIEQINMHFNFAFDLNTHDDGQIYFDRQTDSTTYSYEIQGTGSMNLDNLFFGDQESSGIFNNYVNQNFKSVVQSAGRPFVDVAVEYVNNLTARFFNIIPATTLISDIPA